MKKFLLGIGIIIILYLGYVVISLALLPPVKSLADKKLNLNIDVRDWQGNEHPFLLGPKNRRWTPSNRIPPEMKWAVILAEDSNFYKHDGIDVKAIKEAIKYDLEKQSMARGASTITQQVAKNVFLSREKTITRKLKEVYLAWRMEQELTKGRILELYLNVVELGPMVYGIGHGSQYYFGKPASAMTPRECAFLAAMLPGPRVAYNPYRNLGKVLSRSNMILRKLRSKGVISSDELQAALGTAPNIAGLQRKVDTAIQQEAVMKPISSAVVPAAPQEPADSEPVSPKPEPAPQEQPTAPAAEGKP
ncbi:monofunctional biosynthetic peptidoglycan transglycosylase [Trichlorobacter thiogenes]|uniref:Monofunctional biosynthetic peptidoglycan transglycosylase n=1 Tax=Trichlorobacter thiogenes TaxID=115783 RepID=A0A1T4JYK9_9BACT|nr:biosynthetic peptidoglycan transglycosylase [Trichlorobacter thiogenes]SJZ35306.1 monofunctional biosynthetic peptidoglycan transglycosylase [Trichlorobacter thiogenes]